VHVQTSVPRCIPHLGKPPAFGVWVGGSVIRSPPGLRMTSPGPLLLAAAGRAPRRTIKTRRHHQSWNRFARDGVL